MFYGQIHSCRVVHTAVNMNMDLTFEKKLDCLMKEEIVKCLPHWTFSHAQKCSCTVLTETVMLLPEEDLIAVADAARAKKRCRAGEIEEATTTGAVEETGNNSHFFETVSEDVCHKRISKFIDTTRNNTLASGVCAVCAGQFFCQEMSCMLVDDMHKMEKLVLLVLHSAHILTEGMLLYQSPSSLYTNKQGQCVT
jgi:hypothetical protein